jgi:hypothetical protein
MAIDHDGARRLMAEAMEGRLGETDERELALHLVGCEECKGIYEGLQQAHPALSSIELGYPSTQALDAAVHRATTVLRGEADPGPHGLTEEPPRLPDDDANTVRIDSGGTHHDEDVLVPAGPSTVTGPMTPVTPPPTERPRMEPRIPPNMPTEVPEAHVRPILPDVVPEPIEVSEPEVTETVAPPPSSPAEPEPPPSLPAEFPVEVSAGTSPDAPIPPSAAIPPEAPRSEIESLLDEDRARYEPVTAPEPEEYEDASSGPGPWFVAIAVTVILAVLSVVLITRGQGLFGGSGGDLPSASEVRNKVQRAVQEMKSLKTSFDIQRLNLYRVGREKDSLVYSFSNGTFAGHLVYDRAEGYKQDFTLTVQGEEAERAEIVQEADATRSLVGTGADRQLLVEENPPLGPPDGNLRPALGLLEDSLGTAAALIAGSRDLEVAGKTERDGRELYEVRGSVRPTELSRADRIEANLDANNFLPVVVKRSISKDNAGVLGPSSALTEADISRAFGQHERVTTEYMVLGNVTYDDIVLPNELVLDVPDGVEEQKKDSKFERITHAELSSKLDFQPLLPRTLPSGFEEELLAVYTGEPSDWGPNKTLPKPKHVFHSEYFDGKTTIVVTQRQMTERFDLNGSPLARSGLPITVKSVTRDNKQFFYGSSPEVPPHVYGFLGTTFVMAVGYAPQAELVRIVASLAETPAAVPGSAEISAEPSGSASPGASPSASPAGSPAATASP